MYDQTPPERAAVKALSLAGMDDMEICNATNPSGSHSFPRLHTDTTKGRALIRQWRNRDPTWKAAFSTINQGRRGTHTKRKPKPTDTPNDSTDTDSEPNNDLCPDETEESHTVKNALETSLSDLSSLNSLRMAKASDTALRKFAKRPVTPKTWSEAAQAYRVLRLATGQDSGDAPAVSLNIWGTPGVNQHAPEPAFRDVGPAPDCIDD
jgi:hypothetical protein